MTLAYSRAGSGPSLVLLHGLGHRRQAWDAVLELLTPHRDVITVDLPGHGESPPLDLSHRSVTEALAADLIELTGELRLGRPHLAGNSLGGRIALEAAALGQAASVTALSPAGFWRNDREFGYAKRIFWTMQILGRRIEPIAPRLAKSTSGRAMMYATIVSRPSRMSPEQAEGDMAAFMAAVPAMNAILEAGTPFTASIPGNIPVTIAWGSKDRLLPPRQALVARDCLPDATFVRLGGCGHVPMTDDPELVARVLLRGSSWPRPERAEARPVAAQESPAAR
ncbi:MAG TPA: alpha/beta hydrolase [Streptosporangiaceae bacterium]|nr:alpha/beta hydrolase [Streptosporangiaceae bacterium]